MTFLLDPTPIKSPLIEVEAERWHAILNSAKKKFTRCRAEQKDFQAYWSPTCRAINFRLLPDKSRLALPDDAVLIGVYGPRGSRPDFDSDLSATILEFLP